MAKMTLAFKQLQEFIQERMRMSHIYQPVMLKELLSRGGRAKIRDIAAAFLARDESQLEYYEEITKNMPGKVLTGHGIVVREGDSYRLAIEASALSIDTSRGTTKALSLPKTESTFCSSARPSRFGPLAFSSKMTPTPVPPKAPRCLMVDLSKDGSAADAHTTM